MARFLKLCFLFMNIFVFFFIGSILFSYANSVSLIFFSLLFTFFIYIFGGFEKEKVRIKYEFFLLYGLSFFISAIVHISFHLMYNYDFSLKVLFFLLIYSTFFLPFGVFLFYTRIIPSYNEFNILVIGQIDYCTSYMKRLEIFFFHKINSIHFKENIDSGLLLSLFLKENNINLIIVENPNDNFYRQSKVLQLQLLSIGKISEEYLKKIPMEVITSNESFYVVSFEDKGFDPLIRILDVFISLVIFTFSMPILLISMVLLKIIDNTNIIFRQNRIGYLGRNFNMYKLTTMKCDKKSGEFHVTCLGSLLRKFRINELPQLLNVIKGEMSLVGPRPDLGYEYEYFDNKIPFYHYRLNTLPGITGHAQVYYNYVEILNVEETIKRLEFDLFYVKNYSVYLYMMTILKTIGTVLFMKGK